MNSHHHDRAGSAGIHTVEHLVEHLAEIVSTPTRRGPPGRRTAIVCVGNDFCGDDGAGPAVAKALLLEEAPWDVYDTQTVPESFLMKIVAPRPASVVLIDALAFGGDPGAVEIFGPEMVGGMSPSTHGPAPVAFLDILRMFHPCRCAVVGIEPKNVGFGSRMSPEVAAAVELIAQAFRKLADRRQGPV